MVLYITCCCLSSSLMTNCVTLARPADIREGAIAILAVEQLSYIANASS